MGPEDLARALSHLPQVTDPDVLIGHGTSDDAAVYRLDENRALVMTVDFFTPIVDDAFDFGRIAAANALSDVYAMGATPAAALNIVGFPRDRLGPEVLGRILAGGAAKAAEAGISVVGGHTVDDPELKYGMCVFGFVRPGAELANANARAGDRLFLTKPLGSGILSTAIKRRNSQAGGSALISDEEVRAVTELMASLNRDACTAALAAGVRAATDVTGFGLLGHLRNVLAASRVSARVRASAVPILPGVLALAAKGVVPGGTRRNLAHHASFVRYESSVPEAVRIALSDAQTSGGLLLACPPASAERLAGELARLGTPAAAEIGELFADDSATIDVQPGT